MDTTIEAEFEAISTDEEAIPSLTSPPDDQRLDNTSDIQEEEDEVTEQPVICENQPLPRLLILSSLDEVRSIFDRPELANLGCSYRQKYEHQLWFTCETCFPEEYNTGVCLGCAKQCLINNHEIDPSSFQYSRFFCDKGHQKAGCPKIEGESDEEEEISQQEEEEIPQQEEEEIPQSTSHGQICAII